MSFLTVFPFALAMAVCLCGLAAQGQYTTAAAMSALQYAKAAYCAADDITDWTCTSCKAHSSFTEQQVFQNESAGTQVYVGVDGNSVVVAFRGSQNIQNWMYNLDAKKKAYLNEDCVNCYVHPGFYDSYESVKADVLGSVRRLSLAHPGYSVIVTGHSLGGAMATFAAADIAQLQLSSGAAPHVDLYTFGSPRVGDQQFADWMVNLFCSGGHSSYRVTHKRDMVPHLPTAIMGYVHVSREYWYNNDEEDDWTSCKDVSDETCGDQTVAEDPKCSNNYYLTNIADHLLYLGMCTLCSCFTNKPQIEEPSLMFKAVLAADGVYRKLPFKSVF